MKKMLLTVIALLIGFGLLASSMNFGFSTSSSEDSSQEQEAASPSEGQSESPDSENSDTPLSSSLQNQQQQTEETPSEVGVNSEEQRAVQPQQKSDTLEMSSQLSSSTVSDLTQELDAAIADIKAKDPTATSISIKCTITYPPFKIVCEISWLSTADSTPSDMALQ
jgi:hypothetical protein